MLSGPIQRQFKKVNLTTTLRFQCTGGKRRYQMRPQQDILGILNNQDHVTTEPLSLWV